MTPATTQPITVHNNSIFYGDKLLATGNPGTQADLVLPARLGLNQGSTT